MIKTTIAFAVLLLASLFAGVSQAEKPLGYERYSLEGIDSDYFVEHSAKEVYWLYAKPLTFFSKSKGATNRRLIDIEVHITNGEGRKPDKIQYSGVWIENTGAFKQESWLQLGATAADLQDMNTLLWDEFIPLDMERYHANGVVRFAVIWQRNIHKSHWDWKLNVDAQELYSAEAYGYRVVDFDHYISNNDGPVDHFDAITVENSGGNYVDSEWTVLFPEDIQNEVYPFFAWWTTLLPEGTVVVDVENVNWSVKYSPHLSYAVLVHDVGKDATLSGAPKEYLYSNQNVIGMVVDLEGGFDQFEEGFDEFDSGSGFSGQYYSGPIWTSIHLGNYAQ